MPRIQILDERRYPLPKLNKDKLPYFRWEHRATLGRGLRTYLVFVDNGIYKEETWFKMPEAYIEDITTGNLEAIKDEELFNEIHSFAENLKLMTIQLPLAKE